MKQIKKAGSWLQITSGLGRTLFLSFLLVALMPLSLVSWISYKNATESLRQNAVDSLTAVMEYKREFIKNFFMAMKSDIELQAELFININLLQDLSTALKKSGLPITEFIDTFEWHSINTEEGQDLRAFQYAQGYIDIYLVDLAGNILYSGSEKYQGTNVFGNEYGGSQLTAAYRSALEKGNVVISDYGYYGSARDTLSLFLARTVEDNDTGEGIGVLVFELPYSKMDTFMQSNIGLGKSGETYLLGPDFLMRSNSRFIEHTTILKTKIDTKIARLWGEEHDKWHQLQDQSPGLVIPHPESKVEMLYADYRDISVLGMYTTLDFLGDLEIHWGLIVEINEEEAFAPATALQRIVIALLLSTGVLVFLLAWFIAARLVFPLRQLTSWVQQVANGDLAFVEVAAPGNEIGQLNSSFKKAVSSLQQAASESKRINWLKTGQAELDDQLRGDPTLEELAQTIITYISTYLRARVGTFYVNDGDDTLRLKAGYAYTTRKNLASEFRFGEGLVGQAALAKQTIILANVPDDYIQISCGLGEKKPTNILVVPFLYNDTVKAVLEIGAFSKFTELQINFVEKTGERLAIAITAAQSRNQLQGALAITTEQARDLQQQQEELQSANEELEEQTQQLQASEEELKAANEELEEQTQRLLASEEELQAKQDQLVTNNEELAEKNASLNRQKQRIEQANQDLELSRLEIERKAEDLAIASKYKSEFLANMSHELRTPLNSLLLLAQMLEENRQGNLTDDDIQSVKVIHNSGNDLLSLINDILDLSKIEAGQMNLELASISIAEFLEEMKSTFQHLIDDKGLQLQFQVDPEAPASIKSDRKRLDQVMKNIISNAIKFTDKGSITISVAPVATDIDLHRSGLRPETSIGIAVQDSGVGIPPDKQKIVFEAFQQADGSTARKFGGTGLGLSISRDLAALLGGEIQLDSAEGKGSSFTLYLPISLKVAEPQADKLPRLPIKETQVQPLAVTHIDDDRDSLLKDDKIILVIEDDASFAALLVQQCHEKGLKCLAAPTGEEGLQLAEKFLPLAIILDLQLPGINGWQVLDTLKDQSNTRHIPVHIMSIDDAGIDAQRKGAIGYLVKPVSREKLNQAFVTIKGTVAHQIKDLLVAEHDESLRKSIITLVGNSDVQSEEAASGREVLAKLQSKHYDCLIMGLDLPDMSGFSLLKQMAVNKMDIPPVIVYTEQKLSQDEEKELHQYAESIIVKGVMSEERLLDESALFLHRMICKLPEPKQRMIRNLHEDDSVFSSKRILIVDDDMRNVFAIAKVLQDKGMETVKAENGIKALAVLDLQEDLDLVLMDIMMPGMDGYETMQRIRQQPQFKDLPIIALTAKAMKEDRSRCLEAGANDYLAKPVDIERLLALLRVWLYR